MYETLFNYIEERSSLELTDNERALIKSVFIPKQFRRRQFFLHQGHVCECLGFIVKGAIRQYSVDQRGVEHILELCVENWWIGDKESFLYQIPSIYYIQAWFDTDILVISKADSDMLKEKVPAFLKASKVRDENYCIAVQKRLNAAISFAAEKRFFEFAKNYPELLKKFPQHFIASYLGITKETLSRLRNKPKRNSNLS